MHILKLSKSSDSILKTSFKKNNEGNKYHFSKGTNMTALHFYFYNESESYK